MVSKDRIVYSVLENPRMSSEVRCYIYSTWKSTHVIWIIHILRKNNQHKRCYKLFSLKNATKRSFLHWWGTFSRQRLIIKIIFKGSFNKMMLPLILLELSKSFPVKVNSRFRNSSYTTRFHSLRLLLWRTLKVLHQNYQTLHNCIVKVNVYSNK